MIPTTRHQKDVIAELTELMAGKRKRMSTYMYRPLYKNETLKTIVRYFVENVMDCEPHIAFEAITEQTLKIFHLSKEATNARYIPQVPEFKGEPGRNFVYYAYKSELNLKKKDMILYLYKRVLSGELKAFPSNYFFTDTQYKIRLCCDHYFFENLKMTPKQFMNLLPKDFKEAHLSIILSTIYNNVYELVEDIYPEFLENIESASNF